MSSARWANVDADVASGYSSFEAALARVLAMLGEDLPVGRDWHRKLLLRPAQALPNDRPALIGADLLAAAEELLRFRHVTMRSYDGFDPARAAPAVDAADRFLALVDLELSRLRAALDPSASG